MGTWQSSFLYKFILVLFAPATNFRGRTTKDKSGNNHDFLRRTILLAPLLLLTIKLDSSSSLMIGLQAVELASNFKKPPAIINKSGKRRAIYVMSLLFGGRAQNFNEETGAILELHRKSLSFPCSITS